MSQTYNGIVTLRNSDGTYNEVGTNTRMLIHGTRRIIKKKAFNWAGKAAFRIEYHMPAQFYKNLPPFNTEFHNSHNSFNGDLK